MRQGSGTNWMIWAAGIACLWLAILKIPDAGTAYLPLKGLAYAILAALVLAALSRGLKLHPALGRMVALLACAALAGADTGLSGLHGDAAQQYFFASLLGIALTVLIARHTPSRLRQRWLGNF